MIIPKVLSKIIYFFDTLLKNEMPRPLEVL